jgi:hypothetical protein
VRGTKDSIITFNLPIGPTKRYDLFVNVRDNKLSIQQFVLIVALELQMDLQK